MGYQPKYGPRKKQGGVKAAFVLFVLLGVIVVPFSLLTTGKLLGTMYENVGRPKPQEPSKTRDMQIMDSFEEYVSSIEY